MKGKGVYKEFAIELKNARMVCKQELISAVLRLPPFIRYDYKIGCPNSLRG